MLKRNEKGNLILQSLDFEIFIGDMFDACKTDREIDWLEDEIINSIEYISQDKRDGVL